MNRDRGAAPELAGRARVLVIAHDVRDIGGTERVAAEIVRSVATTHSVTVMSVTLDPDLSRFAAWKRVRVIPRPTPVKLVSFYVVAGLKLLRSEWDIKHTLGAVVPNRVNFSSAVHCHAAALSAMGGLAPRDAPLLRRLNTRAVSWLALLMERFSYRPDRINAVLAASDAVSDALEEAYPGVPVVRVPHGIDLKTFFPDEAVRATVRSEAGVGNDIVTLFVGGDWDRKGLNIAIEAIAKARAHGTPVVLWIVGKGDERRFGRLAARMGVSQSVTFLGVRDSIVNYYRAADIFMLPSSYEAFGLVMLEAAASGLPLLVSPVGVASRLVGDNEGGIIVSGSADDFAQALVALARDTSSRMTMGRFAQFRSAQFDATAASDLLRSLYRTVSI